VNTSEHLCAISDLSWSVAIAASFPANPGTNRHHKPLPEVRKGQRVGLVSLESLSLPARLLKKSASRSTHLSAVLRCTVEIATNQVRALEVLAFECLSLLCLARNRSRSWVTKAKATPILPVMRSVTRCTSVTVPYGGRRYRIPLP